MLSRLASVMLTLLLGTTTRLVWELLSKRWRCQGLISLSPQRFLVASMLLPQRPHSTWPWNNWAWNMLTSCSFISQQLGQVLEVPLAAKRNGWPLRNGLRPERPEQSEYH